MRHPYTRGLFSSIPLPGTDRYAHPLVPIRGQLPLPRDRPTGCTFGPRCDFFVAGRCDKPIPMLDIKGDPGHEARCVRYDEIDWKRIPPQGRRDGADRARPAGAASQGHEEILRDPRQFDRGDVLRADDRASSKPMRSSISKRAKARPWRSSANPAAARRTFAKVLMGLEESTSRRSAGQRRSKSATCRCASARRASSSSLQIVFQNPFETLNPSHSVGAQIGARAQEIRRRQDRARTSSARPMSSSTSSSCRANSPSASRASFRAGRSSASASRAPLAAMRRWWSPTNRSRRSMCRCRRR